MEGPIPVSALLHSATMVTAGVFLIFRLSGLLAYCPKVLALLVVTGALTAFFAATSALGQPDCKKIIALSTCSQLGYIAWGAGLSLFAQSFFHLANHAQAKAMLFLGAGSLIHAANNQQDLRRMGGLVSALPTTYVLMLMASLSLAAVP